MRVRWRSIGVISATLSCADTPLVRADVHDVRLSSDLTLDDAFMLTTDAASVAAFDLLEPSAEPFAVGAVGPNTKMRAALARAYICHSCMGRNYIGLYRPKLYRP